MKTTTYIALSVVFIFVAAIFFALMIIFKTNTLFFGAGIISGTIVVLFTTFGYALIEEV
ncbi:hypothetical protein [Lactococcus allomyrinae]|uniref:hypothetical protein n=1 Tax=Lactococcus allomyrinae TaxID=2419773 RepID=UPI0013C4BDC5|nr:hypothetical protein [Lactococcus allomyrinae]